MSITKLIYPKYKVEAKQLRSELKDNDIIQCEIIGIEKERKMFISKFLIDKKWIVI